MTAKNKNPCLDCRHHRKDLRREVVDVADGDLELVEFEDEPATWFICMHPTQEGKEMGKENAGEGCPLFEKPNSKGLDPELERLLARRDSR